MTQMVEIEINGVKLTTKQGGMIIEAADEAGIVIPRFCYHKKLSIAANCRMCLVEVGNGRKPMPACATPVTDGMKVQTKTSMALQAQRAVMEFLLINHPLDCPICDQGGECELQDLALGYGSDVSRFNEGKRVVKDKNIGPLISTDMTRCIHCTRCVRFGTEIAGVREMGAVGRGEATEITTFIEKSIDSELSGNVIDLCPVGALNSKPFRFSARAWELRQSESIAPHDCIGSNIYVHTKNKRVKRVVPRENESINEVWIADRDRFSYEALYSDDRLQTPLVKEHGQWKTVDWSTALKAVSAGLQRIAGNYGTDQIGALVSPNATLEEAYLINRLMRGIGSHNVDHRLREVDTSDQASRALFPSLGMPLKDIDELDSIVLIGSNVRKEQPIASHRMRKAVHNGAQVFVINPVDFDLNFSVHEKCIPQAGDLITPLAQVAKACQVQGRALAQIETTPTAEKIAERLQESGKRHAIFLGPLALHHPNAAGLRALAQCIGKQTGAIVGELSEGANSAGAWLAGALPHREAAGSELSMPGMSATQMISEPMRAYILLAIEPEYDCFHSALAMAAMQQAEFVVAMTPYDSPQLRATASVLLPSAPYTENTGTYVNVEGIWQSFNAVSEAFGDSRPAWKILRVLCNHLAISHCDYTDTQAICAELKAKCKSMPTRKAPTWQCPSVLQSEQKSWTRIAPLSIYASDALVRRAPALQQTHDAMTNVLHINAKGAAHLQLQAGMMARVTQPDSHACTVAVLIDDRIPDNSVLLAHGASDCLGLGASYDALNIEQV